MKLEIMPLDYHAGQAVYGKQIAAINDFIKDKTVVSFSVEQEHFFIVYKNAKPSKTPKLEINELFGQGGFLTASVQTASKNLAKGKDIIAMEVKEDTLFLISQSTQSVVASL